MLVVAFKYAMPTSVEEINNDNNEKVFLASLFPGSTKNSKPVKSLLGSSRHLPVQHQQWKY